MGGNHPVLLSFGAQQPPKASQDPPSVVFGFAAQQPPETPQDPPCCPEGQESRKRVRDGDGMKIQLNSDLLAGIYPLPHRRALNRQSEGSCAEYLGLLGSIFRPLWVRAGHIARRARAQLPSITSQTKHALLHPA
jgi:hypothetical protein